MGRTRSRGAAKLIPLVEKMLARLESPPPAVPHSRIITYESELRGKMVPTVSLSWLIHEAALPPSRLEKLRAEIVKAFEGGVDFILQETQTSDGGTVTDCLLTIPAAIEIFSRAKHGEAKELVKRLQEYQGTKEPVPVVPKVASELINPSQHDVEQVTQPKEATPMTEREVTELIEVAQYALPVVEREIGGEKRRTVLGSQLLRFLELESRPSEWIPRAIAATEDGAEGVNYIKLVENFSTNPQGGRPSMEWVLDIDLAYHICMRASGDRARLTRRYFIWVKKQYDKSIATPPPQQDLLSLLREQQENFQASLQATLQAFVAPIVSAIVNFKSPPVPPEFNYEAEKQKMIAERAVAENKELGDKNKSLEEERKAQEKRISELNQALVRKTRQLKGDIEVTLAEAAIKMLPAQVAEHYKLDPQDKDTFRTVDSLINSRSVLLFGRDPTATWKQADFRARRDASRRLGRPVSVQQISRVRFFLQNRQMGEYFLRAGMSLLVSEEEIEKIRAERTSLIDMAKEISSIHDV